jgi:hypothetical protein
VAVAARQLNAASEDPNTFTIPDGENSSYGTIAIRPATPPAPPPPLPVAAWESSQTPAGHPVEVDPPDGIQSGDRLVTLIAAHSSAGNGFGGAPTGWTKLAQSVGTFNATAIYTKIADGSEGLSVTMPWTFGNPTQHWTARVTGADAAASSISTSLTSSTTGNPDPPPHAPAWGASADTLWIPWVGKRLSGTATDYPDNYTLYTFTEGYTPPSGTGAAVAVAARRLTAASEDPNTFTMADSGNSSYGTLAIKLAERRHPRLPAAALPPASRTAPSADGARLRSPPPARSRIP